VLESTTSMFPNGLKTIYSRFIGTIHHQNVDLVEEIGEKFGGDETDGAKSNSKSQPLKKRASSGGNAVHEFEVQDSDDENSGNYNRKQKSEVPQSHIAGKAFEEAPHHHFRSTGD
jgi:hypothetical protein